MKTRILNTARLSFPLASALAALLSAPSLHAGQIWDGGGADNNWTTANNWDSNTLPTFTNAITFAGGTRLTPNNNRADASTVGGINFTNTATNAFTLGGNSITLGGNISTTAATSGSLTDTINLAVILNATRTVTTNTNHNLTINGVISQSAASGLTKAGAATLTLGGANTYAGTTTIQGGTLRLANPSAVGGSSGITMNTASNTLSIGTDSAMALPGLTGSSGSFTYTIVSDRATAGEGLTHGFSGANFGNATFATNAGSNVTSGTAGITFSGSPTIGGGGTGTATFAPGSADLTLPSLTAINASKTLALAGTGNGFITGVI
nr:autotransporter-associated beta strand repeat-containing protein [Akkermansiaceae bacterium]